jgi:hypothetical protein
MNELIAIISSYPTSIPTVLIGVLIALSLLAILGALDHQSIGPDWLTDHDHDGLADAPDLIVALGFANLPFSVVITSVGFFWWAFCLLAHQYVAPWIPLPMWFTGSVILLGSFALALPFASVCVKPLKPIFAQRGSNATPPHLIGLPCKVTTTTVDEKFGQAEVNVEQGAPIMIRVYARMPNALTRGSTALIIQFDQDAKRYEIEAYEP